MPTSVKRRERSLKAQCCQTQHVGRQHLAYGYIGPYNHRPNHILVNAGSEDGILVALEAPKGFAHQLPGPMLPYFSLLLSPWVSENYCSRKFVNRGA
jgi:hypothetical protein